MILLLTGLAAFFVVQLVKFVVTPKLGGQGVGQAVTKMALAGAVAFGTALLWLPEGRWKEAVVYGLAGAGLAVILHKGTRLISFLGDDAFTRFLERVRNG